MHSLELNVMLVSFEALDDSDLQVAFHVLATYALCQIEQAVLSAAVISKCRHLHSLSSMYLPSKILL